MFHYCRSRLSFVGCCLLALALAGCSGTLLESKKIDYKSAGKAAPLEIPPDLTAPSRDDRYAIPESSGKNTATYSVYSADRSPQARSQGSGVLPVINADMRVERSGTQRWLVVPGTPDQFWPRIKDFWQELGFVIKVETPDAGVMETDWAEDRAKIGQDFVRNTIGRLLDGLYSTAERDKFRTRIEPGTTPGSTDIFISHRGMVELFVSEGKDQTRWQPRPADPDLEAEMLRRLMVYLGAEEKRAVAITAAAADKPLERARLQRSADGSGALEVQEKFDRAWRRVGLALDRVGFTVEDRDRSNGLYFVRYVDPEADNQKKDDKGFLSKLAFWKSDKPSAASQVQYRVSVREDAGQCRVQVFTKEGGVDNSETARKILGLLFEQLK
jgi:outer membrane protein assembly factor BamC